MSQPRIMIVEDEFVVAADLRTQVEYLGYSVCAEAADGEEAVALAVQSNPDLVLMDIVLRGEKDGIRAAEEVRTIQPLPIIFITAFADEEKIKRAKQVEPFGYLVKPFKSLELKATIETALYRAGRETKRRAAEAALVQNSKDMAGRVEVLTRELVEIRARLADQVGRRVSVEKTLEEEKTALKVLVRHWEEDKAELGEKMLDSVESLIKPTLTRLKNSPLNEQQKILMETIEANLAEIAGPFASTLSSRRLGLTPTEIEVANLIKLGRTTDQIAETLGISPQTVKAHRKKIRAKLGLRGRKTNLGSYLQETAERSDFKES